MKVCTGTKFNQQTKALAESLIGIIDSLKEYWPLTVRQVYYQAVAGLLIKNADSEYRKISRILTKLRRADALPWRCIEDRTRRTTEKRGVSNVQKWIEGEFEGFMNWKYYHRCLIQDQVVYCEVATEKDALASIIENVTWPYCTRLNVVRGQVSATMVNDIAARYDSAIMKGQVPVMLYLGDLDPSGVAIPKALQRNLWEHHSIKVEFKRLALNPELVSIYNLPISPDAAKCKDPNYKTWIDEYGQGQPPVELDALHPQDLGDIVEAGLRSVYNIEEMSEQQRQEKADREQIKQIREDILGYAINHYPNFFSYNQ
jgi:hypothetical protein